MKKTLPARPNLDHLRRQAKELLAAFAARQPDALAAISQHLPSAKGMTAEQIRGLPFRLADAQSVIARQSGFAAWPHLARHVDQLRALEGTWSFARLEVDGQTLPAGALGNSRVLIDGDRFRTESPEAVYEGVFNIDVENDPHHIDIEFIAGPEAGNWNYGIFRLNGDELELCLNMSGQGRPAEFRTRPGERCALELLKRVSRERPEAVEGGAKGQPAAKSAAPSHDGTGFDYVPSPLLTKLQGKWKPVKITRDGQELPSMMLWTGSRVAKENEVEISFAGQTMIHAKVRLDEKTDPIQVDYYNIGGGCKGTIQEGIMKWSGDEACFCMAAPGQPRPDDFAAPAGSGRTFSQWKKK